MQSFKKNLLHRYLSLMLAMMLCWSVVNTLLVYAEGPDIPIEVTDIADLQTAINSALAGDTIMINVGSGPVTLTSAITINKDITITSDTPVTLYPFVDSHHFVISGANTVTLENLVLDGQTSPAGATQGGIQVGQAPIAALNVAINNVVIKNCRSTSGGGVSIAFGSTFTVESGEISGNTGSNGGVAVNAGSTFIMKGGTIRGNTSTGSSGGGGVYVFGNGSSFTMEDGEISGNTATHSNGRGGGVYVGGSGSNVVAFNMSGGIISGNKTVSGNGGGVYVTGTNSTFTMSGGKISGNETDDLGGGGGVFLNSGAFNLINGEISGNKARNNSGGGVRIGGGTFTMTSGKISGNAAEKIVGGNGGAGGGVFFNYGTFIMNGGEISGNTSDGLNDYGGGGVYVGEGLTFTMNGGKISGNTAENGGGVFVNSNEYVGSGYFTMTGGEISGNTAAEDGGGVYTYDYSRLTIPQSSVFEENSASQAYKPTPADIAGSSTINQPATGTSVIDEDGAYIHILNNYDISYHTGTALYHVIYNGNGASRGDVPTDAKVYSAGASLTVAGNTGNLEKDGYTFLGWSTNRNATSSQASFVMDTGGLTIYAVWQKNESPSLTLPVTPTPTPDSIIMVDGEPVDAGKVETVGDTTIVTVNQDVLQKQIEIANDNVTVVIPAETGTSQVQLAAQNVLEMASRGMTLTVQAGNITYDLPTTAIDTTAILAALGVDDESKLQLTITIKTTVDNDTQSFVAGAVEANGNELVIPPIEFMITATYEGKSVEINTFGQYLSRTVEITAEQAARITTAVVVEPDGTTRHVPTNVYQSGGRWYAEINSFTNSVYALVYNEKTFADAKDKWYEATVNELDSRMIITGFSDGQFAGERDITRAEFVAIIVRALGLTENGNGSVFSDISASDWYAGAVGAAYEYGLVSGIGNDLFAPQEKIKRQEAMAIVYRGAQLAGYAGSTGSLNEFSDAADVSDWALGTVQWNTGSGLIVGSAGRLNPLSNITRAETVTVVLRLLQTARLVDVRTGTQAS